MLRKDCVIGVSERIAHSKNNSGCSDFSICPGGGLLPIEFIIKEIPHGENDDTAAFARSQRSSFSRSRPLESEPAAAAHAMQKIHAARIDENTKKLLFDLRLGLVESAVAPTPKTSSARAKKSWGLTARVVCVGSDSVAI